MRTSSAIEALLLRADHITTVATAMGGVEKVRALVVRSVVTLNATTEQERTEATAACDLLEALLKRIAEKL